MKDYVQCPYCGSYSTEASTKGKITRGLQTVGSIVGGALLQLATGVPGILGANIGIAAGTHQFVCKHCGETFKVRKNAFGQTKAYK